MRRAQHPQGIHVPPWLIPLLITVAGGAASVMINHAVLRSDLDNSKAIVATQLATVQASMTGQIVRIDKLVADQERVTRLETRLEAIASTLQDIRTDLRGLAPRTAKRAAASD